jgi:hypothetical protein
MESIEKLAAKLKVDVGNWEEEVFKWTYTLAQEVAKALLESMDEDLMRQRDVSLKVVALKPHRIVTVFGDVTIRRRMYRDSSGKHRFLLDEKMGLDKGCQVSPKVKELATFLSSYFPFQRTEEILRSILPTGISHSSIHRLVARVTDPYLEGEEKELEEVFEDGVIPESEGRVVPHLFLEADGTSVALQREEGRRAEVKVGVAYEGWQGVSKDRHRVTRKTVYSGIMNGDRFWEGFSLTLAKKYDLSQVGRVIVGGDGAPWVKNGAELLGGIYQLDRFHLRRALHQSLDHRLALEVYQACIRGEIDKVDRMLTEAQQQATAEGAKEVARLRGYLLENSFGLRDYRMEIGGEGLRGLGTIEGNVDKLVANRMKKRGMSWTVKGASRMTRLVTLREMGELHAQITYKGRQRDNKPPRQVQPMRKPKANVQTAEEVWIEAGLPALSGPHQNRPWAQVLRALIHGHGGIA